MLSYCMRRAEVIDRLRDHAEAIRAFGVTQVHLYGSAARDEAGARSDIDLFVDVDYERFGFVAFMDLREFMRSVFGRKVDLTTRNALHPDLKDDIVGSAIKIFDDEKADSVAA
jgi:predicted nucleotidyltransferase